MTNTRKSWFCNLLLHLLMYVCVDIAVLFKWFNTINYCQYIVKLIIYRNTEDIVYSAKSRTKLDSWYLMEEENYRVLTVSLISFYKFKQLCSWESGFLLPVYMCTCKLVICIPMKLSRHFWCKCLQYNNGQFWPFCKQYNTNTILHQWHFNTKQYQ